MLVDKFAKKHVDTVCIIGGGSRDTYLNELTARYSQRRVVRGVVEATATGNIAVQMIAGGEIKDLDEARRIIALSE
jgi:sugar (pentulose or hexulose) kinase